MTIPKIIHQTWKNKEIPDMWKDYHNSWKKHFPEPEYKHILWTDEDNENFIKENYSWFYKVFTGYSKGIQRADAIRYFILYHYGGIYADLDCEVRKNFYDLLEPDKINLAGNPHSSVKTHSMNNLMASNPKNEKWNKVFQCLIDKKDNFFTLQSTGPKVLIDAFPEEKDVNILDYKDFNPMRELTGIKKIETLFMKSYKEKIKTWDTAMVVHHGSVSWMNDEIKSFFKVYGLLIFGLLLIVGLSLYHRKSIKEKIWGNNIF